MVCFKQRTCTFSVCSVYIKQRKDFCSYPPSPLRRAKSFIFLSTCLSFVYKRWVKICLTRVGVRGQTQHTNDFVRGNNPTKIINNDTLNARRLIFKKKKIKKIFSMELRTLSRLWIESRSYDAIDNK